MDPPSPGGVPARLGHRPALDGLRGLAVLAVVGHHVGALLLPPRWGPELLPAGFLGVDVFFVLSGFLITTLLLERRAEPGRVRRFYLRRALRLLPAVTALLGIATVVAIAAGESLTRVANTILVVATYTTNWASLEGVSVLPELNHLWSLAVEEQFYVLWPALLWGLLAMRVRPGALLTIALGLALASATWRALLWERGEGARIYFRSDTRADALLLGAAVALVPLARLEALPRRARLAAAVAGLLVLAVAMLGLELQSPSLYLGGFTVVAAASAALIVLALRPDTSLARALAAPPLVAVGLGSYALYLWHFPIFLLARDHLGAVPWPVRAALAVSAAALATWASRRYVELPALALKERLTGWPRARAAASGSPPADAGASSAGAAGRAGSAQGPPAS